MDRRRGLRRGGRQLSEVHLAGPDAYAFRRVLAWAAQQRVYGAGALGPVQAYGLEALQRGMTLAGMTRTT